MPSGDSPVVWCTCNEECPIHGSRVVLVSPSLQYGKEHFAPENALAGRFADLLDQKRLTRVDLDRIKALGYVIETKGGVL